MKKVIILILTLTLVLGNFSYVKAEDLGQKLKGRLLLQVESRGEAWYVNPEDGTRMYMKDGDTAYSMMRNLGLGITNANLEKIPIGLEQRFEELDTDDDGLGDKLEEALNSDPFNSDTDNDGYLDGDEVIEGYNVLSNSSTKLSYDTNLVNNLKGKILLQVESRGEAWYINPVNSKRYYMTDGPAAYQIMKYLSLGITNQDLAKIKTQNYFNDTIIDEDGVKMDLNGWVKSNASNTGFEMNLNFLYYIQDKTLEEAKADEFGTALFSIIPSAYFLILNKELQEIGNVDLEGDMYELLASFYNQLNEKFFEGSVDYKDSINTILNDEKDLIDLVFKSSFFIDGKEYKIMEAHLNYDNNKANTYLYDVDSNVSDSEESSLYELYDFNELLIADWKEYTNDEFKFSFKYPKTYQIIDSQVDIIPADNESPEMFPEKEWLQLTLQDNTRSENLSLLVQVNPYNYENNSDRTYFFSSRGLASTPHETEETNDGKLWLDTSVKIVDNNSYTLNFWCNESNNDNEYKNEFVRIMRNFNFIGLEK